MTDAPVPHPLDCHQTNGFQRPMIKTASISLHAAVLALLPAEYRSECRLNCRLVSNTPRIRRVLMARGRDAADVAIVTTFGPNTLTGFEVTANEIVT